MYRLVTSKVHNSIPGWIVKSLSMFIRWEESLTYDLDNDTIWPMKWSTSWNIFSVGPPLPETIGLPGGFDASLWILGRR